MLGNMLTLFMERKEFFLGLLLEHLEISLISIFIAAVIGLMLGIVISEYHKSSKIIMGLINFLYTIPSISLLGFLIPFSGIGNTTAIIALTVYALLPMVRNTYTGITNIDKNVLEAAKGMGSTDFQILYKIKLPLALPVILSGLRNMATMTIALAGIASFIGAGGLGVAIYRGITTNNGSMTLIGSLLIAMLAILVDFILGVLERISKRGFQKKKISRNWKAACFLIVTLCVALAAAGLLNQSKGKSVRIATKPMTEQYIMGEMLKAVIEQNTDLKVELTQGVGGGTANIEPAMENGEFDLYPEYTGTGWNLVLKKEGLYDESMFGLLQKEYNDLLGFTWMGMYGFNNTFGIVVRTEIAEKYQLKTYSDLAKVSGELTFGSEYDFYEREDGYAALCSAYGMQFMKTVDMDIGLKYQAMEEGKLDVMNIFTTDGQLSTADVTVLLDDKNFYPSYMCGNVVSNKALKRFPELGAQLDQFNEIVTDIDIAKMNYQVETEGKDPKDVAYHFLTEKGFLK